MLMPTHFKKWAGRLAWLHHKALGPLSCLSRLPQGAFQSAFLPSLCSFLLFFLTAPPLHTPTSPPGAGRLSLVSEGVEVGWDVQSVLPLPLIG